MTKVLDQLTELLALALYESTARAEKSSAAHWLDLDEETREVFRCIARGEDDLEDDT